MDFETPVVFIIFNRPETTEKVFEKIREVKPKKLFVIADGPRENYLLEAKKCQETRDIVKKVDWDCQVFTNYSERNLGLRKRISSGLDWVFNQVEEAIILEDDVLPDISFFQFCAGLLEKYRDNEKVSLIGGTNLMIARKNSPYSYSFTRYPQIWGWATWRRFWKHYDVDLKRWPELKNSSWLASLTGNKRSVYNYWKNVFDSVYQKKIETWAYQMTFSAWLQNSLAIVPKVNLVSNIGAGEGATNMRKKWHKFSNLKRYKMNFPLVHPPKIVPDEIIDKFVEKYSLTPFKPYLIKVFLYLSWLLKRFFIERFYEQ